MFVKITPQVYSYMLNKNTCMGYKKVRGQSEATLHANMQAGRFDISWDQEINNFNSLDDTSIYFHK